MAAPELSPPPLRSTLAQKDGFVGAIWARWFQQLWDWLKQLLGSVDELEGRVDALEGAAPPTPPTLLRALYYQPAAQSIPDNVGTVIDFSTADIIHPNVTTGAAWKFTATTAGDYVVSSGATLDFPSPTAGTGILIIGKNGVDYQRIARFQGVTGSNCLVGSTLIRLAAGDFIDVRLYQNSGTARGLEGGRQTWFAIHLLPAA